MGFNPIGRLAQGVSVSGCKHPTPALPARHAQCPAAHSRLGGRLTLEPAGKGPEDPRKAAERSLGPTREGLETFKGHLCKHPGGEGRGGRRCGGRPPCWRGSGNTSITTLWGPRFGGPTAGAAAGLHPGIAVHLAGAHPCFGSGPRIPAFRPGPPSAGVVSGDGRASSPAVHPLICVPPPPPGSVPATSSPLHAPSNHARPWAPERAKV